MRNLKIYKASAGSGKTFQITREYLKLVFKSPSAYKNILAVTFTNKATAEMKSRIISELFKIASGKESGHLAALVEHTDKPEKEVRELAFRILKSLLHDYSRFSVSTIDSFFQRVVRAFAREINLNSAYRTELDTEIILEEAVERVFLDIEDNHRLRKWMFEYAEKRLHEGKNWNFSSELKSKGQKIFDEDFKSFSDELINKLSDKEYLLDYINGLNNLISNFENSIKKIGDEGLLLMKQHGLFPDDFKGGARSFATHFNKIKSGNFTPTSTVRKACDDLDSWSKKSDSQEIKSKIESVYTGGLNKLLKESVTFYDNELVKVNTANAILSELFTLGIFTDLSAKVKEISNEKNLVILNESTHFLNKAIGESNTPFVYEKLGSVYKHFMLDEFQDTSRMQWKNLHSLVENSLSEGNSNLVVGDVKQSIYRWRNGDWNILASELEKEFSDFGTETITLEKNWRSSRDVVNFNNTVFREAANSLSEALKREIEADESKKALAENYSSIIGNAYGDHYQFLPQNSDVGGHVVLRFLETGKIREDFREASLEHMLQKIEELQKKGYRAGDIAVLVRDKNDGNAVVKAILEKKNDSPEEGCCYDVISNDSLVIEQSVTVKFVVNFMKMLIEPENKILRGIIVHEFCRYVLPLMPDYVRNTVENENTDSQLTLGFSERNNYEDNLNRLFIADNSIPHILNKWIVKLEDKLPESELGNLPLYKLAERIISDFKLHTVKGDWPFLEAFLDIILEYTRNESSDLSTFLEWWETVGYKKTINTPEEQDAIKVLTIHKSKGLEFKVVLIPFCDWPVFPEPTKAPLLWCKPAEEPFNKLELVPVRWKKELSNSFFYKEYYHEMLYSAIDNLNLLYVAFTRAVKALYICCPYTEGLKDQGKKVSSLLQYIVENPPLLDSVERDKFLDISELWNSGELIFETGSQDNHITDYMHPEPAGNEPSIVVRSSDELKIRMHSNDYFMINEAEWKEKLNYGKLVHEVFEKIETEKDISRVMKRMEFEGKISNSESKKLYDNISDMMNNERVRNWFSGEWKVLNERDILRGLGRKHRPDRVMVKGNEAIVVDYKTGEESEKHNFQVEKYKNDLKEMNFSGVSGFIWYISNNTIVEV